MDKPLCFVLYPWDFEFGNLTFYIIPAPSRGIKNDETTGRIYSPPMELGGSVTYVTRLSLIFLQVSGVTMVTLTAETYRLNSMGWAS